MKSSPRKIVAIYLAAGFAWILISDKLLASFSGKALNAPIITHEIIKGFAFVLVTGIILYFLMDHYLREILKSQGAYRKLFEQNPCPMFTFDPETLHFLAVNDACVLQYGYTRAEFLSMSINDIRPREDITGLLAVMNAGYHYNSSSVWKHLTKQGKELYVNITYQDIKINGKRAWWVMVQDMTKAKKNEMLLTGALERYDLVAKATNDLIWDWDAHTDKASVNDSLHDLFQYDLTEIDSAWYAEKIHPEDYLRVSHVVLEAIAKERDTWSEEFRLRCADGGYKYLTSRAHILYDEQHRVRRITGIAQDITAAKSNELLLRETLERYDLTVKATNDIIWDWKKATGKAVLSGPIGEHFGYDISMMDSAWFRAKLHPEDSKQVWLSIRNTRKALNQLWSGQFRVMCSDGTYKYVNNRAYIIYDELRKPKRAIGVIQIIQQQKEHEKRIESQNKLLREIAHICSHELRGPVASIKGLLVLINQDEINSAENEKILRYLDMAALKLDDVIHHVVKKANQVYYDEN
jgi:PAS domain S-box-containing protein